MGKISSSCFFICFDVGEGLLQPLLVVGGLFVAGPVVVPNQLATDPALGLLAEFLFVLSVVFSVVGSLLFGFRFMRHYVYINVVASTLEVDLALIWPKEKWALI